MKSFISLFLLVFLAPVLYAQEFAENLTTAKSAYAKGSLEDAHFALQQSLMQLDIIAGKEILKLLPAKMEDLEPVTKEDNVTGNTGFLGATVHRQYGEGDLSVTVDVVTNSPLLTSLNAFMTNPMLAALGGNGNVKVVKIQGYKSRLTKEEKSQEGQVAYRVEIPFSSALITLNINSNADEKRALAMANMLPLPAIAKIIQ